MHEFEATFDVDSKTDVLAVERLINRLYDALREESRTLQEDTEASTEMLSKFEAIRGAARPGHDELPDGQETNPQHDE